MEAEQFIQGVCRQLVREISANDDVLGITSNSDLKGAFAEASIHQFLRRFVAPYESAEVRFSTRATAVPVSQSWMRLFGNLPRCHQSLRRATSPLSRERVGLRSLKSSGATTRASDGKCESILIWKRNLSPWSKARGLGTRLQHEPSGWCVFMTPGLGTRTSRNSTGPDVPLLSCGGQLPAASIVPTPLASCVSPSF